MRLSDAIDGYQIAKKASDLSHNTVELYMYQLGHLLKYTGNIELADIDEDLLQEFMGFMKNEYKTSSGSSLSPSSIEKLYLGLKSFFSWSAQTLGTGRPDMILKKPRYQSPETIPFTHEEITKLIKACKYKKKTSSTNQRAYRAKRTLGQRDTAIVMMLLDTGIRASELCRLEIGDVSLEDGEVRVRPYSTGRKTKPRAVFLGARSREAVWSYIISRGPYHDDHPLFVTKIRTKLNRDSLRHLLNRLGERAGVDNVYPHRFRHTFAIEYLRNGGDIFTLKRLLGHSTLNMVQNYLAIASSDVQNAHRKASPVDRIIP